MKYPKWASGAVYSAAQIVRVGRYLSQAIVGNALLGRAPSEEQKKTLPGFSVVFGELLNLFRSDLSNIESGIYKAPFDLKENPRDVILNTSRVFLDLWKVKDRQERHAVQEFSDPKVREKFPNYFTQTFHFQTDGYLSEESAQLYDTQVEMVFAGGADAMRRHALVPIYDFMQDKDPFKVRLLDVACGTGRFLRFVKDNYPQLPCTGLDLSPYYLKVARRELAHENRVDFVEAPAEKMPFKDGAFSVVTSIYLFHELPRKVRQEAAKEMVRVLEPGGLLVFVDSLQRGDKAHLDGSLGAFPETYHEPYYKDYVEHPLLEEFTALGLEKTHELLPFFSKVWAFRKV